MHFLSNYVEICNSLSFLLKNVKYEKTKIIYMNLYSSEHQHLQSKLF
jgi:hypothetical protein